MHQLFVLKNGEILVGRNSHSEILVLYPDKFKNAEQGFLTSEDRFVDRKVALKIATKWSQIKNKTGCKDELYSEDMWL